MKKFCISISRQFGSLGRPIAKVLSEKLGVNYYDRDIVEMAAQRHNLTVKEASAMEETASKFAFMKFPLGVGTTAAQDKLFEAEAAVIREVADRESCVIVGRCSDSILEDFEHHLSIFIYAPYEDRIVNCVNELGMDTKQAKKMIADVDRLSYAVCQIPAERFEPHRSDGQFRRIWRGGNRRISGQSDSTEIF